MRVLRVYWIHTSRQLCKNCIIVLSIATMRNFINGNIVMGIAVNIETTILDHEGVLFKPNRNIYIQRSALAWLAAERDPLTHFNSLLLKFKTWSNSSYLFRLTLIKTSFNVSDTSCKLTLSLFNMSISFILLYIHCYLIFVVCLYT